MTASEPSDRVPVDRSLVGLTAAPRTFEIAAETIIAFAEAVGDPCPQYRSGQIAPPTFPDTFGLSVAALFPRLGGDLSRGIHGEQEYVYERALRAGDRVTCTACIADVSQKRTRLGSVAVVVAEVEGRDASGELVFTSRATVLVR